uniref:Uncharacterized protein n=1 Tax=Globodera rostochiensis TaxID=31243 RepID=A0A914GX76_GLORO
MCSNSNRPKFIFLILFPTLLLPPSTFSSPSIPLSVSVRCSSHSMEMFVQFREPFHGRLKTRPNGLCFVNGRGRSRVGLRLPLDDAHRRRCAIVRRETEFVAIVDLEMNTNVVTAEDNAYFVRCPIDTETDKDEAEENKQKPSNFLGKNIKVTSSSTLAPQETERETRIWEGREAEELLQLGLEFGRNAFPLRLRKCAVFSPSFSDDQHRVRAVQISDENGCPLNYDDPPSDQPPKFVDEPPPARGVPDHFFIQCEVLKSRGGQSGAEEMVGNFWRKKAKKFNSEHYGEIRLDSTEAITGILRVKQRQNA